VVVGPADHSRFCLDESHESVKTSDATGHIFR
jgi:hypothetical protein